ncbi:hypothetical protein ACTXT7_013964 [Hymenolepis weldensis]
MVSGLSHSYPLTIPTSSPMTKIKQQHCHCQLRRVSSSIIGGEGEEQFIKTIQRCSNREIYVKYVLHVLSQNLFDGYSYTPNLLECVVDFLEGKHKRDHLILIALLVMSQLTDPDNSSNASTTLLERVRDIILPLMEDDEIDSDRMYFGQDVLFNLIRTGRVALDYKKCCKTLFKNTRNASVSKVKAEALAALILLFEKMSDDDLVEFRTNIWYMQCLIKCAAENYLIEPIVHQWLDESDRGHLSYLRNFDPLHCDHVSYSKLFRLFIQGDFRGCVIFAEAGGFEVFRFILANPETPEIRCNHRPGRYSKSYRKGAWEYHHDMPGLYAGGEICTSDKEEVTKPMPIYEQPVTWMAKRNG